MNEEDFYKAGELLEDLDQLRAARAGLLNDKDSVVRLDAFHKSLRHPAVLEKLVPVALAALDAECSTLVGKLKALGLEADA